MKETFKEKNFRPDSLDLIAHCDEVVVEYLGQGLRLTLRQLYYQLVTKNIIKNEERSYKNLSSLVSDARLSGMLDWEAIEDRIRVPVIPSEWSSIQSLVDSALYSYRLPRWETQENYVELWVEKDALAGVLRPLANQYHVPMMVNRGYCVAPEVRVLTADLRWIAAKDVYVGLELLGVDEKVPGYRKHRKLRITPIISVEPLILPRVRVDTDYKSLIVSASHPFLTTKMTRDLSNWHGYRWVEAKDMLPTWRIARLCNTWNDDDSWNAGWLAGLYDGEGCLPMSRLNIQLDVYQKPGLVADLIHNALEEHGWLSSALLRPKRKRKGQLWTFRTYGVDHVLEVLGTVRPARLLQAFQDDVRRRGWPSKSKSPATVRSVQNIGSGPVVAIETGSHTLITEGLVSHNSSQSAMYEASKRYLNQEKSLTLLYLGDFDPSGEDMVRDIADRMEMFGIDVTVLKIALTLDQVKKYKPPPNPTKHKDPRSKDFIAKYGASSWEVDAINPKELRKIITVYIESYIDKDAMQIIIEKENDDKMKLTKAVEEIMNG